MKEQLVSFETAKLAKEKEFDIIPRYGNNTSLYDKYKNHCYYSNYGFMNSGLNDKYIPAPTQALLQKWLREIHGIDVLVMVYAGCEIQYGYCLYTNTIYGHKEDVTDPKQIGWSYEEALEAGLYKALQLI